MSNEKLEKLNAAARQAAEIARNKTPEQRRQEEAERTRIRLQILHDIQEGEERARAAMAHHRYQG